MEVHLDAMFLKGKKIGGKGKIYDLNFHFFAYQFCIHLQKNLLLMVCNEYKVIYKVVPI